MKVTLPVEDSTNAWAGESVAMASLSSINMSRSSSTTAGSSKHSAVPTRPPTPRWSQNQTWASDLENVNIQCINDLNAAFDEFDASSDDGSYDDDDSASIRSIPLDHLEQFFDQLRARTNTIIDEARARAVSIVQQDIPPHHQAEAVNWFGARMRVVMKFLGYIKNTLKHTMEVMMRGMREAWMGILSALRISVARRAVVAVQGVRTIHSSHIETARAGESSNSVPLRLL